MKIKKRNPFIASLFSIISPGLGQIYNGQLKKGILFFIIGLLLIPSFSIAGLYFHGLIFIGTIIIIYYIIFITDAFITAVKIKDIELNIYNKWYSYLILFIIFSITNFSVKELTIHIKAYTIPAGSMIDTLLIGDYVIANNAAYGLRNPFNHNVWILIGIPRRGDVAIFIYPQDPSKEYVKRIIGLPGDRVQIIHKKVYINGDPYEIPQAHFNGRLALSPTQSPRDNYGPVVVPEDHYFFLGDNRDHSYDSRFWGFVPFDLIRGKSLYIYFSWDEKNSRVRWERIGQSIN